MATNTYVALASVTASGTSSVLVMNNIPQTYTDLVLVAQYLKSGTGSARLILNNDSTSLYSQTILYGNGTSASSGRDSGTYFYLMDYLQSSTTNPNFATVHLMNYSNTTTFKTVLERSGVADKGTVANVGLYRSTNAITRIDIADATNFAAGTTFSLYGIKAAVVPTAKATGGTISYGADGYTYHTFLSSGTFTPSQALSCDYLVVAGGGAGGFSISGGGGAGGLVYAANQSFASGTGYGVTIGAGGTGASVNNGSNSTFSSATAIGGGVGGSYSPVAAGVGGSGGGGAATYTGAAGTSGQGYAGGDGSSYQAYYPAGGGGGAGGVGIAGVGTTGTPGNGGPGTNAYSQWLSATGTGVSGYIAGGGGGGVYRDNGSSAMPISSGGAGGGGAGSSSSQSGSIGTPVAGTANTGGGGGGAGGFSSFGTRTGGNGGSGIVIVRYASV